MTDWQKVRKLAETVKLVKPIRPDTDCLKCFSFLTWDTKAGVYVDEEGFPMCYPPGQPLGSLVHTPKEKE